MAYIYKTYSSGGTNNQRKFTASVWVKRCATGVQHEIASAYKASNGFQTDLLKFNSDDTLRFYSHSDSGQGATSFITNAKFRDTNAWYHIVLNVDTTQSTQSERFKMWVNGEQITSWSTSTYPAQNNYFIWGMPTDAVHQIGALNGSNTFNGLMSHFHYVQNANHAPTVFGEYDANGVWKIIVEPTGITYSDQSFWFFKNDNLATDRSGNGNNWSTNGTLTKTEDNPSNVFATLNPLSTKATLSEGNTVSAHDGSATSYLNSITTIGMVSGKYYCECKITAGGSAYPGIGIGSTDASIVQNKFSDSYLGETSDTYGYYMSGTLYNNGSGTSGLTTFSTNDIVGMALDLDSTQNTLKYYKNGSLVYTVNIPDNSSGWFFGSVHTNTQTSARAKFNFGNGYFGTTAVASAGTNASGNGIFEYDVPTGFTALSTKGLNL